MIFAHIRRTGAVRILVDTIDIIMVLLSVHVLFVKHEQVETQMD